MSESPTSPLKHALYGNIPNSAAIGSSTVLSLPAATHAPTCKLYHGAQGSLLSWSIWPHSSRKKKKKEKQPRGLHLTGNATLRSVLLWAFIPSGTSLLLPQPFCCSGGHQHCSPVPTCSLIVPCSSPSLPEGSTLRYKILTLSPVMPPVSWFPSLLCFLLGSAEGEFLLQEDPITLLKAGFRFLQLESVLLGQRNVPLPSETQE